MRPTCFNYIALDNLQEIDFARAYLEEARYVSEDEYERALLKYHRANPDDPLDIPADLEI
jgi:hypothetical protein